DEIHALKTSKQKMEKSLEALQSLKDKDDAESRRLEAKTTDMRGQVKKLQEDLDKQKQDSEALMRGDERSKQQAELVELHKGQAITLSKDFWAVRTDKNLYSKNLVESLEEISEMRKKFKVMCHQIEQLKEEIKEKDVAMIAEHFKHQNISKETLKPETEKTKHTLEFHEKQQTKSQQVVEQQLSDIKKLEATIQEAETERQHQRKEFEAVTSERNILGKQLIRRNEELSLIYEKIKIQESTLGKGEAQYKKLLESLRGQRSSIALKRDLFIAQQQAGSGGGISLYRVMDVRALSEELENPMNVHRWRKLEGSDPAIYVRTLQKRLIAASLKEGSGQAKTEEVVAKDVEIQEKEKLHKELTSILEKQPGPEVLEQLEQYQETYNAKLKQMKAMQSELHTYQSQVSDYKDEIDRLNRELSEVKKKFFEQKKREMMQQESQRGDGRVIHPRPVPQARYMGGLFSLSH
ncbi:Coiled-coil domain-containing protein 147, partial [Symbiodinium microadriaticum]